MGTLLTLWTISFIFWVFQGLIRLTPVWRGNPISFCYLFILLSFRQQTFTCKGTIPLKRLPNGWKHIFWVNLTESFCQSVRPWGLGSEVLPFNRWLGQKAQIWLFSRLPFNIIWEWGNELLVNITFWHDIICAVPVQTTRKSLQNPKMTNGFLVM